MCWWDSTVELVQSRQSMVELVQKGAFNGRIGTTRVFNGRIGAKKGIQRSKWRATVAISGRVGVNMAQRWCSMVALERILQTMAWMVGHTTTKILQVASTTNTMEILDGNFNHDGNSWEFQRRGKFMAISNNNETTTRGNLRRSGMNLVLTNWMSIFSKNLFSQFWCYVNIFCW